MRWGGARPGHPARPSQGPALPPAAGRAVAAAPRLPVPRRGRMGPAAPVRGLRRLAELRRRASSGLPNLALLLPRASVCTAAEDVCQSSSLMSPQRFQGWTTFCEGCLSGQESGAGFPWWHGGHLSLHGPLRPLGILVFPLLGETNVLFRPHITYISRKCLSLALLGLSQAELAACWDRQGERWLSPERRLFICHTALFLPPDLTLTD